MRPINITKFIVLLQDRFKIYLSISLGIFLFILFFQPFSLKIFDFNNTLLFVAGFSVIIFLLLVFFRVMLYSMLRSKVENESHDNIFNYYVLDFFLFVSTCIAFAFYLRYIGEVSISFYIVLKIIVISFTIPVVLYVQDTMARITIKNNQLLQDLRLLQNKINQISENFSHKTVELFSDNNSDNFCLLLTNIVYVKSADNYVELGYKEGEDFKKKLLRNTLKNIELQLKTYSIFVRTHRTCIVNTQRIKKLNKNYNNYWLSLSDTEELIPVARQYLMVIKELF